MVAIDKVAQLNGKRIALSRTPRRLTARMVPTVHRFKALGRHVGVNLGGGNIRVPQHDLDGTQVGTALQKVAGKRMSNNVRADSVIYSGY